MFALDVRLLKLLLLGLGLGLASCASAPEEKKMTSASMHARSGSTADGQVHFHQIGENVNVAYQVNNLAKKSKHGFHIHDKGDCSAPDASSAGPHYNPTGQSHGGLSTQHRHIGDLGNITANELGVAKGEITLTKVNVKDLVGRAVIVHDKPDDEKSDPSGNSGARIACGVLN